MSDIFDEAVVVSILARTGPLFSGVLAWKGRPRNPLVGSVADMLLSCWHTSLHHRPHYRSRCTSLLSTATTTLRFTPPARREGTF